MEVDGDVQNFAAAARNVPGLELADEEELAPEEGQRPVLYLLIPDARALTELLSLWQRWQNGEPMGAGLTPWRDVFATLRALRPWGPGDRVTEEDREVLLEELTALATAGTVRVEIELVFRGNESAGARLEADLRASVEAEGGQVRHRSRIPSVAYHAVLAELPGPAVQRIVERMAEGIAGLDSVLHIRPQAVSFSIETGDPSVTSATAEAPVAGTPILALLDGVPVAQHPLLAGRLHVEDVFDFEPTTLVPNRRHGTAMASLIVHGDRNDPEPPLPRPLAVVPVMCWNGVDEELPTDLLIVDVIYRAVRALRAGNEPLAIDVIVVNLSLGNLRRPFHGRISAWARLLDRLAWEFGILFIVSAGNAGGRFPIPGFATSSDLEAADGPSRAAATMRALAALAADRRLISPGEAINALTIGAANDDAVTPADRRSARVNIDPYPNLKMANPTSRLGPGFAGAVKPEALMPGGREHLRCVVSGAEVQVQPAQAARAFGLRVAAPSATDLAAEYFTNGTSAAAALAARTCHQIHDALEAAYGETFLSLPPIRRALCLKALFMHGARWPDETYRLIVDTMGPHGRGQASKQKDNVRRFCGYGFINASSVVACAADRATFWATGEIGPGQVMTIDVPVPMCVGGQALPHEVAATLAWFSPPLPGRRSYRIARLSLREPQAQLDLLGVESLASQPDQNQGRRGTVSSRWWAGDRAPIVAPGDVLRVGVQRDPDQGTVVDEAIPFALAATLSMGTVVTLYDEVRARVAIPTGLRA